MSRASSTTSNAAYAPTVPVTAPAGVFQHPARARTAGALVLLIVGAALPCWPAVAQQQPDAERGTILFLGDSLTAGYGLTPEQSFPALVGARIDELGLPFDVLNAGVPGETSAGGLRRVDWLLRRPVDILVLELGANDMLRGLPLDLTRDNLQAIIDKTRAANADVEIVIAGMLAPPNLGPEYTREFAGIFPALAQANDAVLIPFLLEDVAARPDLNLPDGIHPNVEGQRVVADNVWRALEPLVRASTGGAEGRDGRALEVGPDQRLAGRSSRRWAVASSTAARLKASGKYWSFAHGAIWSP